METVEVLKLLLKDWKGSYKWLILSVILVVISVSGTLLIPYFSSFLINYGITAGNTEVITTYSIYMIILAIIVGFCEFFIVAIAISFSERTSHGLRSGAFAHIQSFNFATLDKFSGSDLLVRLTTDIQNVKIGIQQTLINVFKSPLLLIISLFFLWITAPELMWVAVVLVILECVILIIYLIYSTKAYDKKQLKYDKLNEVLKESMAGIRVVKAFVRQDLENKQFQEKAEDLRKAALKPQYYYAFITPTLMVLVYIGTAGILYIGGAGLLQGGDLTLGGVTAAMTYLVMALIPITTLGYMIPFVTSGISSLGRVYNIINEQDNINRDESIQESDYDKFDYKKLIPNISFKNVNFAYLGENADSSNENTKSLNENKNETKMVLKDINLDIEFGETIGILGPTGSGKSTLIHLISRFYDVTDGKLTIGGNDIREIPLETLRYHIVGICLQNSNLFSGTIQDNLVSGNKNVTYDEMVEATKAADAYDFINAMPQKYDTVISRGGVDLSGGQRQRLSIARTLILNPKILILDDSTSAVDVATEARIQKAIGDLMQDITQIIVAQRISAIITADKIVLMDEGTIQAVGTHEELLKSNKLYQDIYASQFGVKTPKEEDTFKEGDIPKEEEIK